MADEPGAKSWWQTLPGMITATAGLITAVSGLLVVLFQHGVLGGADKAPPSAPPVAVEASTPAPSRTPVSEAQALLSGRDGSTVKVRADSLSHCISVQHGFDLRSGQSVAFERMRSFAVLEADPMGAADGRAILRITLLDGTVLEDSIDANCDLFGYNANGRFSTTFQQLRQVDFQR
ncbi:hypothetical protein JQX08_07325 [Pseudomonas sp. UL073]|uniref:Uncharacterized protein n=1 Tax=Zestomonas insulae TaxID=2809017 RepID=A0ABS2IF65_9GAMM|nr:hypothetical protein [Pseudomonas insulae]MBM7060515.1 hypothetical protein [Pseudomonas insulae]